MAASGCGEDRPVALEDGTVDFGAPARRGWDHGLNVTGYEAGRPPPGAVEAAVRAARTRTGATRVAIVPVWYVDGPRSSNLAPDPDKTLPDAEIERMAAQARAAGMAVAIKPHVDVRDGSFRGELRPDDRAAFYAAYGELVDRYATLARRVGADTFVIGTELVTLARDTGRWRALARRARAQFGGTLTYAANWVADAEDVRFWDLLDLVGVDAYMPLEAPRPATVPQLRAAWRPWVRRLAALRRRTERDVVFTELGYASRAGATRRPAREGSGRPDPALQARAYEAALSVWSNVPFLRGIWWWEWEADGRSARPAPPGSYTPRDKPAEQVLRAWAPPAGAAP